MTKIEKQTKKIDKIVENNKGLTNYNSNNFIISLRSQLKNQKELTPAQIKALGKMDTAGNFAKAVKAIS